MHFYLRGIASGLLLVAFPTLAAAQNGRVGGFVRDDGGEPIKGAVISAENQNTGASGFTAATDDRGRFMMIGLQAGPWRFVAFAPGYAMDRRDLQVRFTSTNPPLSFTLRKNGPGPESRVSGISPRDVQRELAAADALFNEQKWDEAIAAYRAIAPKAPALTVVNLQIGAAYRQKKDYDGAIAAYNALLAAEPTNQTAKLGIGLAQLERGDTAAAEQTFQQAAEAVEAGPESFFRLAEVKLAKGDVQQAEGWYQKAAAADPSWPKPLYQLGTIALNQGNATVATEFMTRVMAVAPLSPEASLAKTALEKLAK
jgi:tetratricopeptide (TPR) repeat protein